ncbi:unnamed protein product [Dracunculus medinensis]|uniref:Reverse transcriptase domain-containing protein n=1 Tax=Dracunculus medinensis TaxID=318479 RepID=A0A0N4UMF7_DRAME|nr:unnamed protein product [Dracunculus medinensis]
MDTACRQSRGIQISPEHRIIDLEYADDVVLFADSYNEMQEILNNVSETAARIGFRINVHKTKVFSSYEVPDFLGSTLIPNGQAKDDITTRITEARNAFFRLTKPLWNRREITIKTKVCIYIAVIRSILLYGSETWPMGLFVFDHSCLRYIFRRAGKISHDRIHLRSKTTRINNVITKHRLRWLGHILRRPPQELTHISLFAKPCDGWRQKRGGPIKTWTDTVRKDFERIDGLAIYGLRRWKKEWLHYCRRWHQIVDISVINVYAPTL